MQVGANGATTEDPLIDSIETNPALRAYLVEPLPYYCSLLKKAHQSRLDRVHIINAAISNKSGHSDFYHIDETIADEMDGEGPMNRWAHGQGSFDKETIIHWIKQNEFRGEKYRANIQKYLNSIIRINIETKPLTDIIRPFNIKKIDALVIDVQGHELQVLQSCNIKETKPEYIFYEDDLASGGDKVSKFLIASGYQFVAGNTDKLWKIRP